MTLLLFCGFLAALSGCDQQAEMKPEQSSRKGKNPLLDSSFFYACLLSDSISSGSK